MRIALLSAVESIDGANLSPRGHARIGGKSVLQHQMELAITAGCEKIACLSQGLPTELAALQKLADRADVQFRCIRDIRALSAWVSANDDVLVIQDGLAVTPDLARELVLSSRIILTFPATEGVEAGFERIDRDISWAGIMQVPGSLVEKLNDVPDDFDVQSSLLRLALQSGVRRAALDPVRIGQGNWAILADQRAVDRFSQGWIGALTSTVSAASPVRWLAERSARLILQRHADPLRVASMLTVASGLSLSGAMLSAALESVATGFAALTVSVFGFAMAQAIRAMVNGDAAQPGRTVSAPAVFMLLVDAAFVSLVAVSVPKLKLAGALFAALVLIGLIRIVALKGRAVLWPALSDAVTDRGTIATLCVVAALLEMLVPTLQALALWIIACELLRNYRAQLT